MGGPIKHARRAMNILAVMTLVHLAAIFLAVEGGGIAQSSPVFSLLGVEFDIGKVAFAAFFVSAPALLYFIGLCSVIRKQIVNSDMHALLNAGHWLFFYPLSLGGILGALWLSAPVLVWGYGWHISTAWHSPWAPTFFIILFVGTVLAICSAMDVQSMYNRRLHRTFANAEW